MKQTRELPGRGGGSAESLPRVLAREEEGAVNGAPLQSNSTGGQLSV